MRLEATRDLSLDCFFVWLGVRPWRSTDAVLHSIAVLDNVARTHTSRVGLGLRSCFFSDLHLAGCVSFPHPVSAARHLSREFWLLIGQGVLKVAVVTSEVVYPASEMIIYLHYSLFFSSSCRLSEWDPFRFLTRHLLIIY